MIFTMFTMYSMCKMCEMLHCVGLNKPVFDSILEIFSPGNLR